MKLNCALFLRKDFVHGPKLLVLIMIYLLKMIFTSRYYTKKMHMCTMSMKYVYTYV